MEQARLLLELQNYLQEKNAQQKSGQLVSMAQNLRELQLTISKAEKESQELSEVVTRNEAAARNFEQQASKIAEQVKSGKERLYGSKGGGLKELLGLQQSLQKLEEDAEKGEAKYWEMLKEVEEYNNRLKATKEIIKALKAQYNQGVRDYKELKNETELKIAEIQLREDEIISRLKPENLNIFRDAAKRFPTNPVALFRGGNCSGCRISVPSFLAMQIREGKTICYCDSCGRILVQ